MWARGAEFFLFIFYLPECVFQVLVNFVIAICKKLKVSDISQIFKKKKSKHFHAERIEIWIFISTSQFHYVLCVLNIIHSMHSLYSCCVLSDILHFQYFKLLAGGGERSNFLISNETSSFTYFYMNSRVSTAGYCHCVIFPSRFVHRRFWG